MQILSRFAVGITLDIEHPKNQKLIGKFSFGKYNFLSETWGETQGNLFGKALNHTWISLGK